MRPAGTRYLACETLFDGLAEVLWKEVDEGWVRFDPSAGQTLLLAPITRFVLDRLAVPGRSLSDDDLVREVQHDEARRFLAIDAQGQQRFSFVSGGPVRAAPALRSDGMIVFGAYDGVLYALRPDGTLAWTFATADSIQSAPLVDVDGAVVFGSRDNRVYALSPDGSLRWSLQLEEDIDGAPTLGPDGTLYIGSDDRCLHAFK